MYRFTLLCLLCLAFFCAEAQTELSHAEASQMTAAKTYREVSVHDPSIVFNPADNTYYIVGTHRGIAKTSDLTNLTGLNSNNIYTKSYDKEFKTSPAHEVSVDRNGEIVTETLKPCDAAAYCATYAGIKVGDREPTSEAQWVAGDLWAPDLIYNPNMQKWCMYLALNGDYWASVIVLLTSDSPSGPFKYTAPIVFGGFNGQTYSGKSVDYKNTDLELVLGEQESLPSRYKTSAWGNLWPNCIDPCVFFDDEDNLWMAYGSWSGGIFLIKLDKNTGLRDYTTTYPLQSYSGKAPNGSAYTGYTSDPYFGKLLAGGAYVSGEGPYIQKIGDYYFLFMTYGGLNPDGGYEMRIFRSSTPEGPYVDASGADARSYTYQLNFGPRAQTNKGLKIIGAMNNWGSMTTGECAEGHNSAIVDAEGDAYVVYHTKFNNGTFGHQVRIRQLMLNENGWPVASPFRFTGKLTSQADIDAKQLFTPEQIAGTYQLIIHPYKLDHNNMQESTPIAIQLTENGKITGKRTGSWAYSQDGKSYITLTIAGVKYYGVVMQQKVDGYADMPAICITSVSNTGVPAWLYKFEPKAAVADAYTALMNYIGGEANMIRHNAPAIDNVDVTFTTKNAATGELEPETLSPEGVFTKTADGHEIEISIEWLCGDFFMKAGPFVRKTLGENYEIPETATYFPESTSKNLTSGWWSNFSKENYVIEPDQTIRFMFHNYSDEAENWHNWALYGASATHGASGYTEYLGIRNDFWDNTTGSNDGCSANFDWDTFKADMNGSMVDMTVNYGIDGVFAMDAAITTAAGKPYTYSFTKDVPGAPAKITLFFVSEKSYIDGTALASVSTIAIEDANARIFNIYGQEVNEHYKGIVIKNGKKYLQK